MSHTTEQSEPQQQHWRDFDDRDANQGRITTELAAAVTEIEDW